MSTILHILLLALAFFRPIVTMLDLSSSRACIYLRIAPSVLHYTSVDSFPNLVDEVVSCVRPTHHTHTHTHPHTHTPTHTHTHTHTTRSAFREFEESDDLGVAVLSGRGGNFCAGYDLKELAGTPVENILGDFGVGPAPMVSSESKISYFMVVHIQLAALLALITSAYFVLFKLVQFLASSDVLYCLLACV